MLVQENDLCFDAIDGAVMFQKRLVGRSFL